MTDPSAPTHGLPLCLRVPIAAASLEAIETFVGNIVNRIVARDVLDRDGNPRINAILISPYDRPVVKHPNVKLWQAPNSAEYEERLFPDQQVWVHVDYRSYRDAYKGFGLPIPDVPGGKPGDRIFLDHVQNRRAERVRGQILHLAAARGYDTSQSHWHPFLRLCPVRKDVNDAGGARWGGEGWERVRYVDVIRDGLKAGDDAQAWTERVRRAMSGSGLEADVEDDVGKAVRPLAAWVEGELRGMRGQIVYADPMDLTKMLDIEPKSAGQDRTILAAVAETQQLFYP